MNNKVPQALKDKQEILRQATVHTVLTAIHELQEQGYAVKIKDLMEDTGLSRSTFGKTHVRELLVRYGIVCRKPAATEEPNNIPTLSATKRLKSEIKIKNERIAKLRAENGDLKQECELLRGRLFLLMQQKNI